MGSPMTQPQPENVNMIVAYWADGSADVIPLHETSVQHLNSFRRALDLQQWFVLTDLCYCSEVAE